MGLSSFIKQLLETDSVFGVEAKKLTGINDGGPIFDADSASFFNENNNFNLIHAVLDVNSSIDLNPIPKTDDDPDLVRITFKNLIPGNIFYNVNFDKEVPIRLVLLGIPSTIDFQILESTIAYNKYIYNIYKITAVDSNNIIVDLSIAKEGGPDFSSLTNISDLKPTQVVCDPRVFALIDDSLIARRGPQGSTIFNLDNVERNNDLFELSGIASKYAAHYHTEQQIDLVSHQRDDNGSPLYELTVFGFSSNPDADVTFDVDGTHAFFSNYGSPDPSTFRVEYIIEDDIEATVATYGNVGKHGRGTVTIAGSSGANPVKQFGLITGSSVTLLYPPDMVNTVILFRYDLPTADQTDVFRRWPPFDPTGGEESIKSFRRAQNLVTAMNATPAFSINWIAAVATTSADVDAIIEVTAARNAASLNWEFSVDTPTLNTGAISFQDTDTLGTPPVSPLPISGNEFITYDDLKTVLQAETEFNIDVTDATASNTLNLSTSVAPVKIASFVDPIESPGLWSIDGANDTLNIPIGSQIINAVRVDADVVIDNKGDLVYNPAPTTTCD